MKQSQALKVLDSGHNVFLTGSPGSGKTYVLNKFIKLAKGRGKKVAVTATTGIAATHLSGTTIHSWAGIGLSANLAELDLSKLKKNAQLVARYNATDILVIDEVSMLDGQRLDLVSSLASQFRKDNRPFGGMQLVLVGDLFQLSPVNKDSADYNFVYKAECWEGLDMRICYLSEQHRQNTLDGLYKILESIRRGQLSQADLEALNSRLVSGEPDSNLTKLYAHNYDVDLMNQARLNSLDGTAKTYEMSTSGSSNDVKRLKASILAPEKLSLKIACEVMFIVNSPKSGFVNGSRGQVVEFKNGNPVVRLTNGKYVEVISHGWETELNGKILATAKQLPLRLAWAITIHKSQGMSLDAAEIDLSRAFTPGMGYVALSRLRSLEGLYLKDMNKLALRVNSDILVVDKYFRQMSAQLVGSLTVS